MVEGKFVRICGSRRRVRGEPGSALRHQAVEDFRQWRQVDPDGEFTEIESGKRNDSPELEKALATCKKHKAKLVIAKLDRLGRNLAIHFSLGQGGRGRAADGKERPDHST
jgi:DNA invertase Pin-like site-specific DNA recombinase